MMLSIGEWEKGKHVDGGGTKRCGMDDETGGWS